MPRGTLLKTFRVIHLYLGVFIAPALLFFAFTGALQTFGLHETNRDHPNYVAPHWIVVLAQIHKKQTPIVPSHRPPPPSPSARPAGANASGAPPESSATPSPRSGHGHANAISAPAVPPPLSGGAPAAASPKPPSASAHNPIPTRIFFLLVALGLFTSTVTGIYMSYKYNRDKRLVTLALVAGTVIPLLLVLV